MKMFILFGFDFFFSLLNWPAFICTSTSTSLISLYDRIAANFFPSLFDALFQSSPRPLQKLSSSSSSANNCTVSAQPTLPHFSTRKGKHYTTQLCLAQSVGKGKRLLLLLLRQVCIIYLCPHFFLFSDIQWKSCSGGSFVSLKKCILRAVCRQE